MAHVVKTTTPPLAGTIRGTPARATSRPPRTPPAPCTASHDSHLSGQSMHDCKLIGPVEGPRDPARWHRPEYRLAAAPADRGVLAGLASRSGSPMRGTRASGGGTRK